MIPVKRSLRFILNYRKWSVYVKGKFNKIFSFCWFFMCMLKGRAILLRFTFNIYTKKIYHKNSRKINQKVTPVILVKRLLRFGKTKKLISKLIKRLLQWFRSKGHSGLFWIIESGVCMLKVNLIKFLVFVDFLCVC